MPAYSCQVYDYRGGSYDYGFKNVDYDTSAELGNIIMYLCANGYEPDYIYEPGSSVNSGVNISSLTRYSPDYFNGKKYYIKQDEYSPTTTDSTKYYYCGTSSRKSCIQTKTTLGTIKGANSHSTSTSYSYSDYNITTPSGYTLQGWNSSSSKYSSTSYSSLESCWKDGNTTAYGVYKKTSTTSNTKKYYTGSSTQKTVTQTETTTSYKYGAGSSTSSSGYSYPSFSVACDVSGYSVWGCMRDSTAPTVSGDNVHYQTNHSIADFKACWEAGNSTAYGTYYKNESMKYYSQKNGSTSYSTTSSVKQWYYYTGSQLITAPSEPNLGTYEGYTLQGWATSATGTPNTWANQWSSGARTVYAIWKKGITFYYGIGGEWKPITNIYYGINGQWKSINLTSFGINGDWKTS